MGYQRTKPKFEKYDNVRLKNMPDVGGAVWQEPKWTDSGWLYLVQISIDDRRQIIEHDLIPFVELQVDARGEIKMGSYQDLLRDLLLVKVQKPLEVPV